MGFGRGALLWLLGVPLPIILLLALFWHHWAAPSERKSPRGDAGSQLGAANTVLDDPEVEEPIDGMIASSQAR